jgi:hypothetical protein
MIQRASKKPTVVECVKYDGSQKSLVAVRDFVGVNLIGPTVLASPSQHVQLKTLEGTMVVEPGSYVLKGVMGEFWAVRGDIFALTYEILEPLVIKPAKLSDEELKDLIEIMEADGECACEKKRELSERKVYKAGFWAPEPSYCEVCIPF